MKKLLLFLLMAVSLTAKAQNDSPRFTLFELPYAVDALEPIISRQTVELHYGKHVRGYLNNVNKMTAGREYDNKSLQEIILGAQGFLAKGRWRAERQTGKGNNRQMGLNRRFQRGVRKAGFIALRLWMDMACERR